MSDNAPVCAGTCEPCGVEKRMPEIPSEMLERCARALATHMGLGSKLQPVEMMCCRNEVEVILRASGLLDRVAELEGLLTGRHRVCRWAVWAVVGLLVIAIVSQAVR